MSHLSQSALVVLGIAWSVILVNTGYCFYRLLTSQRKLGGDD
jgi:hypothetical protein